MTDEQKSEQPNTWPAAVSNIVSTLGCLFLIILMGTCAGCWALPWK